MRSFGKTVAASVRTWRDKRPRIEEAHRLTTAATIFARASLTFSVAWAWERVQAWAGRPRGGRTDAA